MVKWCRSFELSSRPMKIKYKMSERPHFEIISWHSLGGGGERAGASNYAATSWTWRG